MTSSSSLSEPPIGAYGLRLAGIRDAEDALLPADLSWPAFRLSVRLEAATPVDERVDDDQALLRLRTGGCIEVDRCGGTAVYRVPEPISAQELVHPFLAPVAAVAAYWHDRESIHGGAIATAGRAFGVVGDRMEGKSSLLAVMAKAGVDVVADDVLVTEAGDVFAGPRTIDLREDAAGRLGIGTDLGPLRARERWRLALPPVAVRQPLGGWLFTTWADVEDVRRIPPRETLVRLLRNRATNIPPRDPSVFVQLSALPAWEVRRRRSWDVMPAVVELVLAAVAAA